MADSSMADILKIWKSMSLTSDPTERYSLQYSAEPSPDIKKSLKPSGKFKLSEEKSQVVPEPKIKKINGSMFCVHLNNQLKVYKLPTPDEREFCTNLKRAFIQITVNYDDTIKFVNGNGHEKIYVGFENELRVLKCHRAAHKTDDGKEVMVTQSMDEVSQVLIPGLKAITFFTREELTGPITHLVAVSNDKLFKYSDTDAGISLIQEFPIKFKEESSYQTFSETNPIQMVTEGENIAYLFSSKVGTGDKGRIENLYLSKFRVGESVEASLSMIDKVFELGIFGRSKIFHIGPSAFLMSLYEEIIVVRYHFESYVVWDNVSLAPSKSNEKKGQLVLADKIVMVYTENGEIFAHNIYFSPSEGKLMEPNIDNFKGNDNDEEILYDAIVLQYNKDSFMKVLFYFKELEVYSPKNTVPFHKEEVKGQTDKNVNNLTFNILCIKQQNPVTKLGELFRQKKPPQEINEFCKRFNIDELTKSKCEWSVSEKSEKDIEFLLLEINDNAYIQDELTKILKEKPHDLRFLKAIEIKQTSRYQKLLAQKILNPGNKSLPYTKEERDYIKNIIVWVMESIMFRKKIVYSSTFLEFKEYDFIEIGKLKAASLKEEIKLLSEKGFEKRLKYFLNSFKYMALANFEDIFTFLIDDKTETEVRDFFIKFYPFILPRFEETSEIFSRKQGTFASPPLKTHRNRTHEKIVQSRRESLNPLSFVPIGMDFSGDECELWKGNFKEEEIETMKIFQETIAQEIKKESSLDRAALGYNAEKGIKYFNEILQEFVQEEWFIKNKSKQHSIIHLTIDELKATFQYLKTIGVFHFLIKIFESKVEQGVYKAEAVNETLNAYVFAGLVPQSFKANIDARRKVLAVLPDRINVLKPTMKEFLTMEETQYFSFLMRHYKQMLLVEVKQEYDAIEKGFFREKFHVYLHSDSIELGVIIDFLDEFEGNENDDIRKDVFDCIKHILKLSNREDAQCLVNKLMDREIFKDEQEDELIEEAKVVYGLNFFEFLDYFSLDYTYEELIEFTRIESLEQNVLLMTMLQGYCKQERPSDENEIREIEIVGGQGMEGLEPLQILDEPLNFFGLLLLMMSRMKFKVSRIALFDKFVELLLEVQMLEDLVTFIRKFIEVGAEGEQEHELEGQPEALTVLLYEFYCTEADVRERVITCIIKWARMKYYQIKPLRYNSPSQETPMYENLFDELHEAFKVLKEEELGLVSEEVSREESFLEMVKALLRIFPSLVPGIIQERFLLYQLDQEEEKDTSAMMNEMSGFMFMMKMILNKIPGSMLTETDDSAIISTLYELECVHDNFVRASKYHPPPHDNDDKFGLTRFFMELSLRLIAFDNFNYCLLSLERTIQTNYYFRNVFFEFLASVEVSNPAVLVGFVQEFIATGAKGSLISKFKAFVQENSISRFEKDWVKSEKNTKVVLEAIVRSGRIDEAFYFLVRNDRVQIRYLIKNPEMFGGREIASYALIAIYIKCLKSYLYKSFYPTFWFYMQKHSKLVSELERMDIIKDINIAISRLQQEFISESNSVKEEEKAYSPETIVAVITKEFNRQLQEGIWKETDKNDFIEGEKKVKKDKLESRKTALKELENHIEGLTEIYRIFMRNNHLDPDIKLDELDLKQIRSEEAPSRLISYQEIDYGSQKYSSLNHKNEPLPEERHFRVEDLEGERIPNKELEEKKRQIQDKGGARLLEMQKDAQKFTRELEKTKEELDKKRANLKKFEVPQDNFKAYEELKEKQKQELASVKSSYKSKASENINKMLEDLKRRREKLYDRSAENSKFSRVSVEDSEFSKRFHHEFNREPLEGQMMPPPELSHFRHSGAISLSNERPMEESNNMITNSMGYQVQVHGVKESSKREFLPLTFEKKPSQSSMASEYLEEIKRRKGGDRMDRGSQKNVGKKVGLEEMVELFEEREPQCKKYVEKLGFIKNNLEVGVQITKSIYSAIYGFDMFVKYLEFMFQFNPQYKTVLEYKAYQIASQALGIEYKVSLKELFPIELFLTVHNIPMKEYYRLAYDTIRPNLLKILARPDTNVHGLAVLFRYGFGSENTYYSQVYEDYIGVILKDYANKEFDDSKLYRVADKLRTLYSNLSAADRDSRFEKLMRVLPEAKKRKLVGEMLNIIEKRKQILTGDQGSELKALLARMH